MSTLCDRILRYGLETHGYPYPKNTVAGLETATVINADNVAEYLWVGTSQEEWNVLKDIPSVAPPWPDAFIEFKPPSKSVSEEFGVTDLSFFRGHCGVRVTSESLVVLISNTTLPESLRREARELLNNGIAWMMSMTVFWEFEKGNIYPVCRRVFGVKRDGKPIALRHDYPVVDFVYPSKLCPTKSLATSVVSTFGIMTSVAALTYCFCNCAKTEIIQHTPDAKLQRSYRAKTGKSLVRYNTIKIEAVNRVLRSAVGANGNIKQALHICRGHFKDYRERGLFGKVKGVFWWDMSVRGNADAGVVTKDYAVGGDMPHTRAVAV